MRDKHKNQCCTASLWRGNVSVSSATTCFYCHIKQKPHSRQIQIYSHLIGIITWTGSIYHATEHGITSSKMIDLQRKKNLSIQRWSVIVTAVTTHSRLAHMHTKHVQRDLISKKRGDQIYPCWNAKNE